MPHTRSAKKNLRKTMKHRLRNRSAKKDIKDEIKKVEAAAAGSDLALLKNAYNIAAKKLDKAAARRIVHPNLAARKKSQLARLVHRKASPAKA
jgi:small subunit ribosomal protein S20